MKRLMVFAFALGFTSTSPGQLPDGVDFKAGPLNSVSFEDGGRRLVIYGSDEPGADFLLLTHVRRDLVEFARSARGDGDGRVVAPNASAEFLAAPEAHWEEWWEDRFDYYKQQVTRLPLEALPVGVGVAEGDKIDFPVGPAFTVMETPGHTREGVTYLAEVGGKTIAFCGDLVLAGGRVPDLYSFQEAIPEAKIGGYHGYGGRLAQLVKSLEKLAAAKPDIIIPLHGEPIFDPQADIEKLILQVQKIYANYLSTNALNWYFKEERLTIAGRRVLGEDADVELMEYSEHVDLPEWCKHLGTTKLLLAEDGSGFVLDVGGQRSLESLRTALADGLVKSIDGIFVTHTHNDHSAAVGEAAREFGCPVYAVYEVADVLERPGSWFLPGISPNVVDEVQVLSDGAEMKWKNFKFTAHFFPGQMYNHGALLVERDDHAPVFFIGDSFSPSGIDDYCLMNRNLMREDTGLFLCLKKVRELPEGSWMVNQHIAHLFRFDEERIDLLEQRYAERRDLIAELTPWDDANFAIDERWASFYPYGQVIKGGFDRNPAPLELRIWNHSTREREIKVTLNLPDWIAAENTTRVLTIPPRKEGRALFFLHVGEKPTPGIRVITADLESDDFDLKQWAEAIVKVEE